MSDRQYDGSDRDILIELRTRAIDVERRIGALETGIGSLATKDQVDALANQQERQHDELPRRFASLGAFRVVQKIVLAFATAAVIGAIASVAALVKFK